MGDIKGGEYLSISQVGKEAQQQKKDRENDSPPAPQAESSPSAKTDDGLDPGMVDVDEFYVETLCRANLPGVDGSSGLLGPGAGRRPHQAGRDRGHQVGGRRPGLRQVGVHAHRPSREIASDPRHQDGSGDDDAHRSGVRRARPCQRKLALASGRDSAATLRSAVITRFPTDGFCGQPCVLSCAVITHCTGHSRIRYLGKEQQK
jgi:hypothetical protein